MSLYAGLLRPLLFRLEAERAHELACGALGAAQRVPGACAALSAVLRFERPQLRTRVAGLDFPNPVGLAAGFDKDCRLPRALEALGFGFLELGTVTPEPQAGNPRPRVFRVPECDALLNRLGFNSAGARDAARRLARRRGRVPVGVNIGPNARTSPEEAVGDYARAFELLRAHGDYFVLNVSSPNTRGLRELQERLRLERILLALKERNPGGKPLFVKLSPDLEEGQLEALAPLLERLADGAVVCNTTTARDGLPPSWAEARGGVSGAPLRGRSTDMIARLHRLTAGRLPIIGVGGIFSAEDAYQKIRAGASLVQLYTGLVYRGPGLVREIKRGLLRLLEEHRLASVADAVGLSAGRPAQAAAR